MVLREGMAGSGFCFEKLPLATVWGRGGRGCERWPGDPGAAATRREVWKLGLGWGWGWWSWREGPRCPQSTQTLLSPSQLPWIRGGGEGWLLGGKVALCWENKEQSLGPLLLGVVQAKRLLTGPEADHQAGLGRSSLCPSHLGVGRCPAEEPQGLPE